MTRDTSSISNNPRKQTENRAFGAEVGAMRRVFQKPPQIRSGLALKTSALEGCELVSEKEMFLERMN